jgi:pilus assembly protein TadC
MFRVVLLIVGALGIWSILEYKLFRAREMGRFREQPVDLLSQLKAQFDILIVSFGTKKKNKQSIDYQAAKAERDMLSKLKAAGLESPAEQGRFFLMRIVCGMAGPLIGVVSYSILIPYYATIATLLFSTVGLVAPLMWLKGKAGTRTEDVQRELPLVLDLTNLGTSAGWDVAASMERVIDTLHMEMPNHPLMKELKRARWLTSSGYTWAEALDRVARNLGHDVVRRATLALTQAMRQGGDRTSQLEGIAEDAQRSYYADVDKRLASMPVKVLLVTLALMISFFIIVLSPAVVQVKDVVSNYSKHAKVNSKVEKVKKEIKVVDAAAAKVQKVPANSKDKKKK